MKEGRRAVCRETCTNTLLINADAAARFLIASKDQTSGIHFLLRDVYRAT